MIYASFSFMNDFPVFLRLTSSFLNLNFTRSSLITSLYFILDHHLVKPSSASNLQYLPRQEFSCILCGWSNHSNLLFCEHSLMFTHSHMLFNVGPFLSFTAEIISSCLALCIHLTILASNTFSISYRHL